LGKAKKKRRTTDLLEQKAIEVLLFSPFNKRSIRQSSIQLMTNTFYNSNNACIRGSRRVFAREHHDSADPGAAPGGDGSSAKGKGNEYLAARGPGAGPNGWELANITPPVGFGEVASREREYEAFSPDLSEGVLISEQPLLAAHPSPQGPEGALPPLTSGARLGYVACIEAPWVGAEWERVTMRSSATRGKPSPGITPGVRGAII
jgi:hypothetical protein